MRPRGRPAPGTDGSERPGLERGGEAQRVKAVAGGHVAPLEADTVYCSFNERYFGMLPQL